MMTWKYLSVEMQLETVDGWCRPTLPQYELGVTIYLVERHPPPIQTLKAVPYN